MSTTGHTTESRERNPKNQQKDVESRCFLQDIPQYKECTIHKRLVSIFQEESSEAAVSNFKAFPLRLTSVPASFIHA